MEGHESPQLPLWLAGIVLVAIPALAANGLVELVKTLWLGPWRRERLAAGLPEPSWRWVALLGSASAALGACIGCGMATFDELLGVDLIPLPAFWGLSLGVVGGTLNAWIVRLIKRRARRAVDES